MKIQLTMITIVSGNTQKILYHIRTLSLKLEDFIGKSAIFDDYLKSIINKNFDNADEIIKDIFKNDIRSNQITLFLNRPEVLRV